MATGLPDQYSADFESRKYAWREEEHPRGQPENAGEFAPKDQGADHVFGRRLTAAESAAKVGKIRAGDARSKNDGRGGAPERVGELVESKVPTNLFDSIKDREYGNHSNFLRATTNKERVKAYESSNIQTPIFVSLGRTGRPFVSDGGHRFVAAMNRGDEYINALVPPALHEQLWGANDRPSAPKDQAESSPSPAPFKKTGGDFGTFYHGGKESIAQIDPARLQSRDPGFYGRGFYVATTPTAAKMYGRTISKFRLKPDAKVLESTLRPQDASQELRDAVAGYFEEVIFPKAKERGRLESAKEELQEAMRSPISWKDAVNAYGRHENFDVIKHSDGEVVVRNLDVIEPEQAKAKRPPRKPPNDGPSAYAKSEWSDEEEKKHPRDDDGKFTLKVTKVGGKSDTFEFAGNRGKQKKLFGTEGMPGQMNLFADTGVPDEMLPKERKASEPPAEHSRRYEKDASEPGPKWRMLGGAPVQVGDDGVILKGCPGLKGRHIDELDETQDERAAVQEAAEASGWTSAKSDRARETHEQWQQVDPDAPSHIGLIRHDGKFHAFDESAKTLQDELGIGDGQTAEFDEDKLGHHVERLKEAGHNIAVIDREEDGSPNLDSEADPEAQQAVEEAYEDVAEEQGSDVLSDQDVMSRLQNSPQATGRDINWEKYAERWGVAGQKFHAIDLPVADLVNLNQNNRLLLSRNVNRDDIEDKKRSGSRNPVVIAAPPNERHPLAVLDGTHSLHAAHEANDDTVPVIISESAARYLGIQPSSETDEGSEAVNPDRADGDTTDAIPGAGEVGNRANDPDRVESQPEQPDEHADAWNAATKSPSAASDEQLSQAVNFANHLRQHHAQSAAAGQITGEQRDALHEMIDGHVAKLQGELERRQGSQPTSQPQTPQTPAQPATDIPSRHMATGQNIAKAPAPLRSMLESLHRLRDTRKTGKVETKELGHDYAKEMYDHLRSLRAKGGDDFGEVHDLSDELGHGAIGYASPAGNVAMIPPKFKNEDWQVRYTLPHSEQASQPTESAPPSQPAAAPEIPDTKPTHTKGLVVASRGKSGTVYYGRPMENHGDLYRRHKEDLSMDDSRTEEGMLHRDGFAYPDGVFLTRDEAENSSGIQRSSPAGLDAADVAAAQEQAEQEQAEPDDGDRPWEEWGAEQPKRKPINPRTRLGRAIIEAVGNDPNDQQELAENIRDIHAIKNQETRARNSAMIELMAQFGFEGRDIGKFVRAIQKYDDADSFMRKSPLGKKFDQMVEMAVNYYPQLLQYSSGEAFTDDPEYALFDRFKTGLADRLKTGLERPPQPYDDKIIAEALERMASGDRSIQEYQDRLASDPEYKAYIDSLDESQFSRRGIKQRYVKWARKSLSRWRYARQLSLFDDEPKKPSGPKKQKSLFEEGDHPRAKEHVDIQGREYEAGQWIPKEQAAQATPAEADKIEVVDKETGEAEPLQDVEQKKVDEAIVHSEEPQDKLPVSVSAAWPSEQVEFDGGDFATKYTSPDGKHVIWSTDDGKYELQGVIGGGVAHSSIGTFDSVQEAMQAAAPSAPPKPATPTTFDPEQHGGYKPLMQLAKDIDSGKLKADEYKQQYAFWREHEGAFKSDLVSRYNAQQLKNIAGQLGDWNAKSNSKEKNAASIYNKLLIHAFHTGGTFSYGMDGPIKALDRHVAAQTDESFAKNQAAAEEESQAQQQAIENPQTLSDFHLAIRHHGGYENMPEHLQAAYDDLQATQRRAGDKSRQATVQAFRPGTEATGEIGIVTGHHQKRNAPTWTVTIEKHLGDNWQEALSRAKQLGGSYVNARIAKAYGATPGFQFFDQNSAEKFAQTLRGEAVDRSDVMDERRASQIDNASERMTTLANLRRQRAEEKLAAPRQTNTARRAEMASSAEAQARSEIAKANTMQRIAEGLQDGSIKHLSGIRAGTHVDSLDSALRMSKYRRYQEEQRKPGAPGGLYDKMMEEPYTNQDVTKAEYPYPTIWASELKQHIQDFADTPGLKKLAASLKKTADRSPFAKRIGKFATDGGVTMMADQLPDVPRTLFKDQAVRIHASRDPKLLQGRHAIAYTADGGKNWGVSPEIAVNAALNKNWEGLDLIPPPRDELLKISDGTTIQQLEEATKRLKRSADPRLRRIAESLGGRIEDYHRLQSMDIRNVQELRAALREYLPLRAKQEAEDPVRAKERAIVGRDFPGFFPTPKPLINKMLDAADIQPGMSVLEPSAGKGDILDSVKERHPEAVTKGIEYQPALRDIILTKGHDIADENDFLSHAGQYDRIVMNPPFENRQDVQHVQHAYNQLKPGGRLVAVMSSGPFHGSQKRDAEFRDWLNSVGAEIVDNPEGSFAGSDAFRKTGVNTKMLVIDKTP